MMTCFSHLPCCGIGWCMRRRIASLTAQEVKSLRLAEPALLAIFRRKASELDEPGLLGVKRQRKLLQPCAHFIQKAPGVGLVLEPDNEVVGVAHDDHIARGLAPSPAFGPEIERIVQVDVGQEW